MAAPRMSVRGRGPSALVQWARALQRPERSLLALAEVVRQQAEQSIATRTDPWGRGWPAVAESTKRIESSKRKRGAGLAGRTFVRRVGGRVVAGIRARFGRAMQYGAPNNRAFGSKKAAPIPPRPFFPVRPNRRVDMPPELLQRGKAEFFRTIRESIRR